MSFLFYTSGSQTAGSMGPLWVSGGGIWSETKVNEQDLCNENKQEETDVLKIILNLDTFLLVASLSPVHI